MSERTERRQLRFIRMDESPAERRARRAVSDLEKHAQQLLHIATMPRKFHRIGLWLVEDYRIYTFELNPGRWPDRLWYLLDRDYEFWRGHRLAFTADELDSIGVPAWGRSSAIRTAFEPADMAPMATDCFQLYPRSWLSKYAKLVGRLADYVDNRDLKPRYTPSP